MIQVIKNLILFSFIILFISSGCKKEPEKLVPIGLNEKLNFNDSLYHQELKNRFSDKDFSSYMNDSSFQYLDTLKQFYYERNFQPVFIKSFEQKDFIDSLLSILNKADEHGLDPELYHISQIKDEFYNAINDTIKNPESLRQLADSELFACDGILKFAYHMRYGVVNPKALFPDSYTLPVVDSSKRDIFKPLQQENIIKYLSDVQPKSEKYKKLQIALKHFKNYKDAQWDLIPVVNKKIVAGSRDSSITLIAERLIKLGYLDTSKVRINDLSFYDSLLIDPIKKFQRLNGLNDDGVIGKGTVERLNVLPQEYVNKIKLNLERFRWNNYSDTSRYILVNIPDFKLYAVENGKKVFDIKVCTGQKRSANYQARLQVYKKTKKIYNKPDDWETPCLYAQISNIILNPTWTVPASIIREEILREVKKDSNYLQTKNFKVYKGGVELNLKEVNVKDFTLENIPYTIVQDPGAGNALGKIKFMFLNPFGIYLHDTPTRAPFSNSNRAVSHGCVRVEKPLIFAEYILKDNSKWNIDYLKIEIGQKVDDKSKISEYYKKRSELRKNRSFGQTTEVVLDKKIPLFIDYYTAWVDDNNEVNFRDDVYNKDKILKEHLFPEKKLQNLISSIK